MEKRIFEISARQVALLKVKIIGFSTRIQNSIFLFFLLPFPPEGMSLDPIHNNSFNFLFILSNYFINPV